MDKCIFLVPVGACGAGIHEEAFAAGLAMAPDCIAMDAGSTDSGPAYLAKGVCKYAAPSVAHDLELCISAAVEHHIPLFIGSCGTCGTDSAVDCFAGLAEQIIIKGGYHVKVATISSQMDPSTLERKWDEGKIHPLPGAPEISRDTFATCSNIVDLMGAEPFIEAYRQGAQIVLAGRATDTGVIAAFGLMNGMNEGACWHGAKVVECGPQCSDTSGTCVMLEVDREGFTVYPTTPQARCTPYTVSAHLLYENTNPFRLTEPGGCFLTEDAVYSQITPQACRVTGSRFQRVTPYTMKLEGARLVGYQNISLVGIADRDILQDLPGWTAFLTRHVQEVLDRHGFDRAAYSFHLRCYGCDAVVPLRAGESYVPREVGLLLTVTADTQEMATAVAKEFNPYLLHLPKNVQSANDLLPTFAFPFSPVDTPRGPIYEFVLHHVVDVSDPLELVQIHLRQY